MLLLCNTFFIICIIGVFSKGLNLVFSFFFRFFAFKKNQ